MKRTLLALAHASLLVGALAATSRAPEPEDGRLVTNRVGARELALPDEDAGAFTFAVFGDRTGGPADGVQVLAQAVDETNLLGPDLVMTVGDLVQGYNTTPDWLVQAAEFRGIMDRLDMPWFPVAGNHDVYWRGAGRPEREHEENYERHFGPLWYAFEHKGCWFLTLFADETNPDTGEKRFGDPAHQRMSPEQFAWLQETLARTGDARHVFVFLHHPRWLGGQYGDDWNRVHELLVAAGNVTAVFAGHIHHMRYDPRDGIEYFALATVGGVQAGDLPEAGYLHQYSYVTVRDDGIATVSYPVGSAQDPRAITGEVSSVSRRAVQRLRSRADGRIELDLEQGGDDRLAVELSNPLERPVEVVLRAPDDGDPRWRYSPGRARRMLEPGASETIEWKVARLPGPIDDAFAPPRLVRSADVVFDGLRVPLPDVEVALPVAPKAWHALAGEHALALDGRGSYARVPSDALRLPDGPFAVQARIRPADLDGGQAIVAKTESSEFGLFARDDRLSFMVHLDGGYRTAVSDGPVLVAGEWQTVTGVFDGRRVRAFVGTREVASVSGAGPRRTNGLPLLVGAEPDSSGDGREPFHGAIDRVRVLRGALLEEWLGESTDETARREDLVLHLDMQATIGPWIRDASPREAHAELVGAARAAPAQ